MMRSMNSAVSGLKAEQVAMDVIGNNVANVNTVGYKASRATFEDMMSQMLKSSSASQGNMGGTNPQQVGLGVAVGSIDTSFTDGSPQTTDNPLDVAISGNGFFTVGELSGSKKLTRAGNFGIDEAGNLVTSNGYFVYGWTLDSTGKINTSGDLTPINIYNQLNEAATKTTKISLGGNLNANLAADDTMVYNETVYDSLGASHNIQFTFTKAAATNSWSVTASTSETGVTVTGSTTLSFGTDGKFSTTPVTMPLSITVPGADSMNLTVDLSTITQYAGAGQETDTIDELSKDGNKAGSMESYEIDKNGNLNITYTNGQNECIATLAIATVNNSMGLNKIGDNMYEVSNNSGDVQYGTAGTGNRGLLNPESLEMSNVDLAQEFTNMIVTQRGYEANSKVITASDTMLQDLVNIIR